MDRATFTDKNEIFSLDISAVIKNDNFNMTENIQYDRILYTKQHTIYYTNIPVLYRNMLKPNEKILKINEWQKQRESIGGNSYTGTSLYMSNICKEENYDEMRNWE